MIRNLFIFSLLIFATSSAATAESKAFAASRPEVAVVIDFTNYVFFDSRGNGEIYPLRVYGERLRELASLGIGKFYLRVNVYGLSLYPSRVTGIYGTHFGRHRYYGENDPGSRLARTLELYNPLLETIRIGHQLGVEVWAWESLFDDAGNLFRLSPEHDPVWVSRYGEYPLMSPFFRRNPGYYAMRSPAGDTTRQLFAQRNREAEDRIIGRIVVISGADSSPLELSREQLVIFTGSDNHNYQRYTGPVELSVFRANDRNIVVLDQLEIPERFVKFGILNPSGEEGGALILAGNRGTSRVFDRDGKMIPAVWGVEEVPADREDGNGALSFSGTPPTPVDSGLNRFGFGTGEPDPGILAVSVFPGMSELAIPEVFEHKLARFSELAEYGFDGFMMNLRTSGFVSNPDEYGFNPELREQFWQKYGIDIWNEEFDQSLLREMRADAVDRFYAACKRVAGSRPFHVSALPNRKPGESRSSYDKFGLLPWHYQTYFREESVDGVSMLGEDFSGYFTGEVTGDSAIRLGLFIEAGRFSPQNFQAELQQAFANPELDEVEIYEGINLSFSPEYAEALRKELERR